jgi:outer membrane lipoprotein SlyB
MRLVIFVSAVSALLGACAAPSKTKYGAADVGRWSPTSEATIVSSRLVSISEQPQGYGPLVGGAMGATGAAVRIGADVGFIAAGLLGGVIGAGVGYLVEQVMRTREGIEYMIRMPDGRMQTLVQNRDKSEEPMPAGTEVLVQHAGRYIRLVEKPAGVEDRRQEPGATSSSARPAGDLGTKGSTQEPNTSQGAGASIPAAPLGLNPIELPGRHGTIRPRQQ